jgi:type II secretion system protein G
MKKTLTTTIVTFAAPITFGSPTHNPTKFEELLDIIRPSLHMFYLDCGRYPSTEEGLTMIYEQPEDCPCWGPDPYTKQDVIRDDWGNPFQYSSNGPCHYQLVSYGADGKEGGTSEDKDIVKTVKCKNSVHREE